MRGQRCSGSICSSFLCPFPEQEDLVCLGALCKVQASRLPASEAPPQVSAIDGTTFNKTAALPLSGGGIPYAPGPKRMEERSLESPSKYLKRYWLERGFRLVESSGKPSPAFFLLSFLFLF